MLLATKSSRNTYFLQHYFHFKLLFTILEIYISLYTQAYLEENLNILLTGTGACQTIPAFRCRCAVCCQARDSGVSSYKRNNCCAVVSPSSGGKILIDAPPQLLSQLDAFSVDDRDITSLLLSHRHDDHILGLFHLLSVKPSKGAVLGKPVDLYVGKGTRNHLFKKYKMLTQSGKSEEVRSLIKLMDIKALESYTIEGCRVVPLETNHLKMKAPDGTKSHDETYGYFLAEAGKSVCYLIDAAEKLPDETVLFMRTNPPDCIIIDCTYSDEDGKSGHGDIESVKELRSLFPDGRMIVSHISHKNLLPDQLERILAPFNIELGYDGMNILL
jgi:phosphoribosyl 1,2-cyclic phosphate phosphodiesterase